MVLKVEQIQGVFRGQVIVCVLRRVGEEGDIFFIIKMKCQGVDRLGHGIAKVRSAAVVPADSDRHLPGIQRPGDRGDLPAILQNRIRYRFTAALQKIDRNDQVVVAVAAGVLFSSRIMLFKKAVSFSRGTIWNAAT